MNNKPLNIEENCVVFIHGNSCSPSIFEETTKTIEGKVINVTLPGHEASAPSSQPDVDYSMAGLRSYLIQFLNKIDQPFILAGHSLGGHLAIQVIGEIDLCYGLVLFGCPPMKLPLNLEEVYLPSTAAGILFRADNSKEDIKASFDQMVSIPSPKQHLIQHFNNTDPRFRVELLNSVTVHNQSKDEVSIIQNLKQPVHFINGKQDPIVNMEYVRSLSGITSIYEIDDCGHFPSIEQPVKFGEIMNKIEKEIFND